MNNVLSSYLRNDSFVNIYDYFEIPQLPNEKICLLFVTSLSHMERKVYLGNNFIYRVNNYYTGSKLTFIYKEQLSE